MGLAVLIGRRLGASGWLLWITIAIAGVAIQAALWSVSEPEILFSDFYKAYFSAAEALWHRGARATWETSESAVLGFVNIPVLAWLFAPLAPLGELDAAWLFFALGVTATVATFVLLLRLGNFNATTAAILALSCLANGPLVNTLREGNTTHFILLLLVVALLLWRAGAEFSAGLVLGFCAMFKLPLMLFALYFLLRRRWRIVAGGATMIGGIVLLSLLVFGLDINIGWYRCCVEPFLNGVMPAFNVQSIDGFLLRLETGHSQLREWTPLATPLWHKVSRSILLAAMFAFVFWAICRISRADDRIETTAPDSRDYLEFSLVLTLAIVASPVSWSHYYALMLLPWGLYLGRRLPLPDDMLTRWLMTGGFILTALPVVILPLEPGLVGAIAARTIVSAWLFGAILMLAALLRGALQTSWQHVGACRVAQS
jgi:Glycosyltransferase family 87